MLDYVTNFARKRKLATKYRALVEQIETRGQILGRYPLSVQVETTSVCNAECYFCPYPESWEKHHPGRMSDELYRKIIDDVAQYKVGKFCPYLGTEPLADAKIFDRIEYAVSRLDFRVLEMSTNASIMDSKKIDNIVRIFPRVPHQIWISFHGVDEQSFRAIMGLDFERCRANVLNLIERAQDHNLNILIRGAGTPRIDDGKQPRWFTKEQYLRFWKTEFDRHGFRRRPNIDAFTYHDRAGQIKRNEVNYSKIARESLKNFYCTRFDQWIHFLYTGEVVMCCMDYKRESVIGDIRKHTIREIFQSEEYLKVARREVGLDESAPDFICKRCFSPGG